MERKGESPTTQDDFSTKSPRKILHRQGLKFQKIEKSWKIYEKIWRVERIIAKRKILHNFPHSFWRREWRGSSLEQHRGSLENIGERDFPTFSTPPNTTTATIYSFIYYFIYFISLPNEKNEKIMKETGNSPRKEYHESYF